ncbi:MAG: aspartate aminotransferase family protein [Proteobacteria bacterium]|jgi:acetylornithine aminotransferase|nr:aspartate aminotransferase family protein [Pseudomonadota bacterium]
MANHLMQNYAPLPVTFAKGDGAWLWDTQGNKYLDALSGVAVCGLGHAHPAVAKAVCEQAQTLLHTSNWYHIALQETLADRLTGVAEMERAFFCNSGAEANEAAIKLARLFGHGKGINKPAIIVMDGSFHGRTLATLTATGSRKVQAGFEPLVQGFVRAPYNDLDAINNIARNNNDVVAVLVEPVIGEGGIRIPDVDYLPGLRQICDAHGWLLILDEIQTGMGRTGKMFAYQHSNIHPDVITLAKGLGNGVPIGACLARGMAAELFQPGHHGSTYGGNPMVCAAALAVLDTLEQQSLAERAAQLGDRLFDGLKSALDTQAGVVEIRGCGLMLAIELDRPCSELMQQALDVGLLINVTAGNVVRLLPPLILSDAEADQIVAGVSQIITAFLT